MVLSTQHPEGPRVAVETDLEQLGGQGKEPVTPQQLPPLSTAW